MGKVKINWDKFDKTYEFNLPKINKVKFIGSITKRKHKFAILGIKISATPIKNLSISVNIVSTHFSKAFVPIDFSTQCGIRYI